MAAFAAIAVAALFAFSVGAICLVPTKDLAHQVYSVFNQMAASTPLKIGLMTGKWSFNREKGLFDIIIATPGRLVDHLETLDLSNLRFLVIDEAE